MYKTLIRPLIFKLDPEIAHALVINLLKILQKMPFALSLLRHFFCTEKEKKNPISVAELFFSNRVGMAAGFDKNAEVIHALAALGFGFIEIGSVTPRPQSGNPKKRLFRLVQEEGIINRMGINNEGVEKVAERLKDRPKNVVIGANIAKNTDTPESETLQDYVTCFETLLPHVDYFTLNLSCPNVPSNPQLRDMAFLRILVDKLVEINRLSGQKKKSLFVKISPDLNENQLDDIVQLVKEKNLAGIIATNTTVDRQMLSEHSLHREEKGGLSGKPLREKSLAILRYLNEQNKDKTFTIIGVGGVDNKVSAKEKIDNGADLIQLYSGLIYQGLALVKALQKL